MWLALLAGRLEIATLVVRKAVLPQPGIAAHRAPPCRRRQGRRRQAGAAPSPGPRRMLPRRILLDDITWVDAKGQRITVDAEVELGRRTAAADGRVQGGAGPLRRHARAASEREADLGRCAVDIGGGTHHRPAAVAAGRGGGGWRLNGDLATQGVEVAALTAPSKPLTGKLEAQHHAALRVPGARPSWRTCCAARPASPCATRVVQGIDLRKAVQTLGLSRGGNTPLDTLTGQVTTQGKRGASDQPGGDLRHAGGHRQRVDRRRPQALSGRVNVDLTAAATGHVGVPLAVGGTLDDPSVTLTRGALLGAAVGTLVAPGVGHGGGRELGDKLGEGLRGLFGK